MCSLHIVIYFFSNLPGFHGHTTNLVIIDCEKPHHSHVKYPSLLPPCLHTVFLKTLFRTGEFSSHPGQGDHSVTNWRTTSSLLQATTSSPMASAWTKNYLQSYCSQEQYWWIEVLPWAEYAQNSFTHSSSGLIPFQHVLGYQAPLFPWFWDPVDVQVMDNWFWRTS